MLALLTPAAHAGHWKFSAAGSSETTTAHATYTTPPTPTPWTAPADSDNTISMGFPSNGVTDGSFTDTPSCDLTETATVKITATWVSDTNSDNTAPTSVWFIENASASWSGAGKPSIVTYTQDNADNGLSDPYAAATPPARGGSSTTSTAAATPPDGWHKFAVSGGSVTLPVRTLTATAHGTGSPGGVRGQVGISTAMSYSISVHAQPYNWRIKTHADNGSGGLIFTYSWSSTSGTISDINSSYWHEYVTYDGPVGTITNPNKYYLTPDPPFDGTSYADNPEVSSTAHTSATLLNGAHGVQDSQLPVPFDTSQPYAPGTITSHQTWQFDGTSTGETNVTIPGPDSGPLNIVRSVTVSGVTSYLYTVTKEGYSASMTLP